MSPSSRDIQSIILTPSIVDVAVDILGARLAAIILTGDREAEPSIFTRAFSRNLINPVSAAQLRLAVDIARGLLAVEDANTVRAWFVGKNELLGDRAPALVLRENPQSVRAAARKFLAYG